MTPSLEVLLDARLEQRILPGLERVHRALETLGRPDRTVTTVLVVGTNGKGSTAAVLASVLGAHGIRTGLYTSPHLVTVEERIRVGSAAIPRENLVAHLEVLQQFQDLSYFETLTCAALLEFRDRGVELAILEAGLGGRWDAVNATDPVVTLLTNVGTDHQTWLGQSRTAIAAEKAAALRGVEGIIGRWDPEVEPAIRAAAASQTPLSMAARWVAVESASVAGDRGQTVRWRLAKLHGTAQLPLLGAHQRENATLALAGAVALETHGFIAPLSPGAVSAGLAAVQWPGRLQWLGWRDHRLLLDGGHNLEAMESLGHFLDQQELSGRIHLVFSCLDDKPLAAMAAHLAPRVTGVTVVELPPPRNTNLATLAAAFPGSRRAPDLQRALEEAPSGATVLVTGSLRLVGAVLALAAADGA